LQHSLHRRDFLTASGAAAFVPPAQRPNILYIHSHDTGRYVQPYGYAVPAPNLQRLAEQGMLFRQAFNAAPTCSPSRASLLTGMCPHNNGMLGLAHRGFVLNDYKKHIIHTLRSAGYRSTLIGLQHIAADSRTIGYDEVIEKPPDKSAPRAPGALNNLTKRAAVVVPDAVKFLNSAPKQPFWLTVGFFETHRLFHPRGSAEDPRYTIPPHPIPDTPQARMDMCDFKATARVLDNAIGAVLHALEVNGLAENTLVICTTDHGVPFPGMKSDLRDHGMGVMLIMRGPGGFSGGKVCDAMISQMDLFPTLCELLDIERPGWLQGRSILPVIGGKRPEVNDEIFAEFNYHASYEPQRAVRTRRWKYIRRFDGRTHPVLPNFDDSPSKTVWLEHGWKDRRVDTEQLYDLVFDPNETNNLAGVAEHTNTLAEMRGRLNRWMASTNDPLLRGPVPAPHGARVNDPDGISPSEPPRIVP
jgi:N-sulfoglucosamine sulfohydrolase